MKTKTFAAAMLQYRNMPCRFLGVSSAQIFFARKLRDGVCGAPVQFKLWSEWVLTAEQGEQALTKHHAAKKEFLSRASKDKEELALGSMEMVQTQWGPQKGWVEDICYFYLLKKDRSGRLSK